MGYETAGVTLACENSHIKFVVVIFFARRDEIYVYRAYQRTQTNGGS